MYMINCITMPDISSWTKQQQIILGIIIIGLVLAIIKIGYFVKKKAPVYLVPIFLSLDKLMKSDEVKNSNFITQNGEMIEIELVNSNGYCIPVDQIKIIAKILESVDIEGQKIKIKYSGPEINGKPTSFESLDIADLHEFSKFFKEIVVLFLKSNQNTSQVKWRTSGHSLMLGNNKNLFSIYYKQNDLNINYDHKCVGLPVEFTSIKIIIKTDLE